jgi:hypothetical protein
MANRFDSQKFREQRSWNSLPNSRCPRGSGKKCKNATRGEAEKRGAANPVNANRGDPLYYLHTDLRNCYIL